MGERQDAEVNGRSVLVPVVLGFMAGALSGAAVALLLAPSSGRDTRAQIGDAYHKGSQKVARLPAALKSAGKAARTAFAEARAEEPEVAPIVETDPAASNTH